MKFKKFIPWVLISFSMAMSAACSRTETIELPKPGKAPAEAQYLEDTITYYQMNDGTNSTVVQSQGPINLEGKRVGIHVTTAFKKDGVVRQRTIIQTENGTLIANGHPLMDNNTGKFEGLIGVLVAPDGNQYWMRENTGPWQPLTKDKTSVSSAYTPINKFFCTKSLQWKDIPAGANATDTACVFEPGSLGESGESIRLATVTGKIGTQNATLHFKGMGEKDGEKTATIRIVTSNSTSRFDMAPNTNGTGIRLPKTIDLKMTDGNGRPVTQQELAQIKALVQQAATKAKSAPTLQERLAAYGAATGFAVPMANNVTTPTNATGTQAQSSTPANGTSGMHFGHRGEDGKPRELTPEERKAGSLYAPTRTNSSLGSFRGAVLKPGQQ